MYYFDDPEKQQDLKRICDEWLGTRFRHRCCVKQGGVDCTLFVAAALSEAGAITMPRKIPEYEHDYNCHRENNILVDMFLEHPRFKEVGCGDPQNGDVILYYFGRCVSHSGIYIDNHVYQAINQIGVRRIHWNERRWYKRKRHGFRVLS